MCNFPVGMRCIDRSTSVHSPMWARASPLVLFGAATGHLDTDSPQHERDARAPINRNLPTSEHLR